MDKNINLSGGSVDNITNEKTTRVAWVDKHAELIAKLEAEYQLPIEAQNNLSETRYHEFSVGDLNILISDQYSPEILEDNVVYPMLLTPDWVIGTCNVRGEIIPIFDLEKIIYPDISVAKPTNYKTLILHEGNNAIGLPLFKLPELIHLEEEDHISNYSKFPELIKPYVKMVYKRKLKIWVLIDFSSFFTFLKTSYIQS